MAQTTEKELAAIIKAAVAPVQFKWGWAAMESANLPPSQPLVVMVRTLALATPYLDMCTAADIPADVNVSIHVWVKGDDGYEQARELQAIVRAAANGIAHGWALQSETDQYDASVDAWQIASDWQATTLVLR